MDWVDKPQNYKGLYGFLQLLQGSHLINFPLKTQTWLGSFSFSSISAEMIIFLRNNTQTAVTNMTKNRMLENKII